MFIGEKSTAGGRVEIDSTNGIVQLECGTGSGDEILIGGSSSEEVDINARVNQDLDPSSDNAGIDLGSSGLRWDHLFVGGTSVGDIEMGNGWIITEADKVYEGVPGEEGIYILNEKNRRLFLFDKNGKVWARDSEIGRIEDHPHYNLPRKNPIIELAHKKALGDQRRMDREAEAKLPKKERKAKQYERTMKKKGYSGEELEKLIENYKKDLDNQESTKNIKDSNNYKRKEKEALKALKRAEKAGIGGYDEEDNE